MPSVRAGGPLSLTAGDGGGNLHKVFIRSSCEENDVHLRRGGHCSVKERWREVRRREEWKGGAHSNGNYGMLSWGFGLQIDANTTNICDFVYYYFVSTTTYHSTTTMHHTHYLSTPHHPHHTTIPLPCQCLHTQYSSQPPPPRHHVTPSITTVTEIFVFASLVTQLRRDYFFSCVLSNVQ